ncbi:MAG TPA: flavodoxin domain-containing protein [Armatimonadota bacterium]|jgi:menaquinone-dependent protoporphyrinogen oxidase
MRILVAYVSGFGATEEVAKEIASILAHHHVVDLRPLNNVRSLDAYEAVVVGSSLRADKWLGGMFKFLSRFRTELAARPLAIFTIALTARTLDGSRRVVNESLPKLMARFPELHPVATEAFGGVLNFDKYNPVIRTIMRRVAQQEGLPTSGLSDFRDWEAIRHWAAQLGEELAAHKC